MERIVNLYAFVLMSLACVSGQMNFGPTSNIAWSLPTDYTIYTESSNRENLNGSFNTCTPSATVTLQGSVCSGQTIFEDDFDGLSEDKWTIEQYIPTGPDFPFVSYQKSRVSVEGGFLYIKPKLQETMPGFFSGYVTENNEKLDLNRGCTRPRKCVHVNHGSQIMPPIASGRITSNHMFAFKYGVVEVRAMLPIGDWLYPDIILESLFNKYGSENYDSGVIRIAGARGNGALSNAGKDYSNKVLYGGPIMNFKCREHLLATSSSSSFWGTEFHIFKLRWTPDSMIFSVDEREWGRIEAFTNDLRLRLYPPCDPPSTFLINRMAPFDDFFRLAFGVAAGGISEFPDSTTTSESTPKPWKNNALKAKLNFINDVDSWHPTWDVDSQLVVDYVKVTAL